MVRISTTTRFEQWRTTFGVLLAISIAVRILAAAVLLFGPWTDQPNELAGWDIERFVDIATATTKPWAEAEVEYPPASVAVFEALTTAGSAAQNQLVGAHRILVVVMLSCDLLSAGFLGRRFGSRAAVIYLTLGLPLVPMGLLRLDLATTLLAIVAVVAVANQPGAKPGRSASRSAAALVAATAVKVWPALVIMALWLLGRRRPALVAAAGGGLAVALWLWWAGAGLDPVRQVVSLRGATGWHVESTAGLVAIISRLTNGQAVEPVLELNAFRVGTISPLINSVGRLCTVLTLVGLGLRARDVRGYVETDHSGDAPGLRDAAKLAAVVLGSLAMLLGTAPLFSPQFMLWLTPWAAVIATYSGRFSTRSATTITALTMGACLVTGAVLAAYGPSGLATALPATLLLARNGMVLALPVACWFWLGGLRAEMPDRGPSPRLQLPNSNVNQVTGEPDSL